RSVPIGLTWLLAALLGRRLLIGGPIVVMYIMAAVVLNPGRSCVRRSSTGSVWRSTHGLLGRHISIAAALIGLRRIGRLRQRRILQPSFILLYVVHNRIVHRR